MKYLQLIKKVFLELLSDTYLIIKDLFKIIIPAIIIVKILSEIGVVELLSIGLEPIMQVFGLPGEMALVWTTAIVTNIYGAIAVYMIVATELQITAAQSTVLWTLVLICHSLPVEVALTNKVGGHGMFMACLRFFGACIAGIILNYSYKFFGLLTQQTTIYWTAQKEEKNYLDWTINQVDNLITIALVLFCLLSLMKFLNAIKFTDLMAKVLKPLLMLMGISQKGASIAVFGLLAGITFGSGLLLAEVKKHSVPKKDIFLVLAFLSLCHGIIEDTTLMLLMGGHISGLLFFRLVFSVIAIAIIARVDWQKIMPARLRRAF